MERNIDSLIRAVPFVLNGYTFHRVLKEGTSSCILRATQNKTGRVFSIKAIHCVSTQKSFLEPAHFEIDTCIDIPHPNIITLYNKFVANDFVFLVLDYCGKGSVQDCIMNNYKFTYTQIKKLMKQVLNAVEFCHSQGIAHRNINPSGVLISDDGIIKLADFELGFTMFERRKVKGMIDPINFAPPESFLYKKYNPYMADIWSLGVVFYYLVTKNLPWRGDNPEKIRKNILAGEFETPSDISPEILRLVKKMLVIDPNDRANARELTNDPMFDLFKAPHPKAVNNFNVLNYPICKNAVNRKGSAPNRRKIFSPLKTPGKKNICYCDLQKLQMINNKKAFYV